MDINLKGLNGLFNQDSKLSLVIVSAFAVFVFYRQFLSSEEIFNLYSRFFQKGEPTETGQNRRNYFDKHKSLQTFDYFDEFSIFPDVPERTKHVEHSRRFFKNHKGVTFHTQKWVDASLPPRGLVFFVHGYSTSSNFSYELLCRCVAARGFHVVAMDGYGHGLSDGLHGYIPDFEEYAEDYFEHYRAVARAHPNLKSFIVSTSMGGAVALKLLTKDRLERSFHGAVFASPMIKVQKKWLPRPSVIALIRLASYFYPAAKWIPKKDFKDGLYNNKKMERYLERNKIFYRGRARLRTSLELFFACVKGEKHFKEVDQPVMVVHGAEDEITCPNSSREFFEAVSSEDKTFILYPGEKHCLFFDFKAKRVFEDVVSWIEERL